MPTETTVYTDDSYKKDAMPKVRDILDGITSNKETWRIKILSGRPRCWFQARHVRHVNAGIKIKNGRVMTKSKSLDDKVLDMRVPKIKKDLTHNQMVIYAFRPYGRIIERFRDRDLEPELESSGATIIIPDGIDEELPFN